MAQISVTIISKNEAKNIGPCLRSVNWADEIVVVDDFSTDGTDRMARDLGARLAAAQNHRASARKTTCGWFWLDAQGRISHGRCPKKEVLITKPPGQGTGLGLPVGLRII